MASLGSSNVPGGCSRQVSFTTAFRYGSFSMSVSETFPLFPTLFLSSSCAFFITRGFFASSAMAQAMLTAEVSDPPRNMF
ncbi:hypothetical protein SLEP1_g37863 [Rubroshorea leprosula]|uniref:Uncharacterized protein n=1 Tax=Rubroshorea leprosula TaxID=152421 RepID=A0AAV5KWD1_9ROSI|nr:hypothetical protein SLEP1_g37863 [Rubroshorea leprosula]